MNTLDQKIEKVYRLLEVKTLSNVRPLIGLYVHYREWEPKFAIIAIPMYACMKKRRGPPLGKDSISCFKERYGLDREKIALIRTDYTKPPLQTAFVTIASFEGWL